MAYFPMFVDLTDKNCLVIGGGTVAYRKIKVLMDFDARIDVVALDIISEIKMLAENDSKVNLSISSYEKKLLENKTLVIVATTDDELNRRVAKDCNERNIPVNVVDRMAECSFIFPSYLKKGDVVAAFSSSGKSPVITQYLKRLEADILTDELGEINDTLGKWRDAVKAKFPTEELRKEVFLRILNKSVNENRALTDAEIESIIGSGCPHLL